MDQRSTNSPKLASPPTKSLPQCRSYLQHAVEIRDGLELTHRVILGYVHGVFQIFVFVVWLWWGLERGVGEELGRCWRGVGEWLGRAWLAVLQKSRLENPISVPKSHRHAVSYTTLDISKIDNVESATSSRGLGCVDSILTISVVTARNTNIDNKVQDFEQLLVESKKNHPKKSNTQISFLPSPLSPPSKFFVFVFFLHFKEKNSPNTKNFRGWRPLKGGFRHGILGDIFVFGCLFGPEFGVW